MLYIVSANVAWIVWFAATPENVCVPTAPTDEPSTTTFSTWYPVFGVMVNVWLAPWSTVTAPDGLIDPFVPAVAVIVYSLMAKLAEME